MKFSPGGDVFWAVREEVRATRPSARIQSHVVEKGTTLAVKVQEEVIPADTGRIQRLHDAMHSHGPGVLKLCPGYQGQDPELMDRSAYTRGKVQKASATWPPLEGRDLAQEPPSSRCEEHDERHDV